jgi:hypothetical protein
MALSGSFPVPSDRVLTCAWPKCAKAFHPKTRLDKYCCRNCRNRHHAEKLAEAKRLTADRTSRSAAGQLAGKPL